MSTADLHYGKAIDYARLNQIGSALEEVDLVLDEDPAHANALYLSGYLKTLTGDLEEGIADVKAAIEVCPDNADMHYNLGCIYENAGMLNRSAQSYKNAIELNDGHVEAWYNLGNVQLKTGLVDEAIEAYDAVLERDSTHIYAMQNIGTAYRTKGDEDKALEMYRAILQYDPQNLAAKTLISSLVNAKRQPTLNESLQAYFDDTARSYDANKTEQGDQTPRLMREAVLIAAEAEDVVFEYALDLGCGTGRTSRAMIRHLDTVEGVDISPGMLSEAVKKGLYKYLYVADATTFLNDRGTDVPLYDLIMAGDLMPYMENVPGLFKAARKNMKQGAGFCFSVDKLDGGAYEVLDSLHYAHSENYIRACAEKNNFDVALCRDIRTCNDVGAPSDGLIFVLTAK